MIRTLLGLFVPAALRAIDEAEARATAAELNEARAIGERDESRREAKELRADCTAMVRTNIHDDERIGELEREIETLRSEVASASEECDDVANLRIDLGRAEIRTGQLQRERDELQRRLDARGDVDRIMAADG